MKTPLLLLALIAHTASAQSYKCDVDGKTTYTDRPCSTIGGKTEKVIQEPTIPREPPLNPMDNIGEVVACGILLGGNDALTGRQDAKKCQEEAMKKGKKMKNLKKSSDRS